MSVCRYLGIRAKMEGTYRRESTCNPVVFFADVGMGFILPYTGVPPAPSDLPPQASRLRPLCGSCDNAHLWLSVK